MSRGSDSKQEQRRHGSLLTARVAIEQQIADLDRRVMKLARNNAQVRQLADLDGRSARHNRDLDYLSMVVVPVGRLAGRIE